MRKMILLCFALGFSFSAMAAELKIKRFALIDPFSDRNTVAELCLSVTPSPTTPVFIEITIDPGTRQKAFANAWVDSRGSVCTLVSTLRGRIEAKISGQKTATRGKL